VIIIYHGFLCHSVTRGFHESYYRAATAKSAGSPCAFSGLLNSQATRLIKIISL
jgi:hypothetical protein